MTTFKVSFEEVKVRSELVRNSCTCRMKIANFIASQEISVWKVFIFSWHQVMKILSDLDEKWMVRKVDSFSFGVELGHLRRLLCAERAGSRRDIESGSGSTGRPLPRKEFIKL